MDGYESRWRTLFILFVLFLISYSSTDFKVGAIVLFKEFLLNLTEVCTDEPPPIYMSILCLPPRSSGISSQRKRKGGEGEDSNVKKLKHFIS